MTGRGMQGLAGLAAGCGAALVMAFLVVAASAGPTDLVSRPRASLVTGPPTSGLTPTLTAEPRESVDSEGVKGWDPDGLLAVLVQVVVVLVVIAVLVLLALAVRDLLRRVAPRLTSETEPGFGRPEVPAGILEGADLGLDAMGRGTPRNAIVAAWVALEQAAAMAGLPRHRAETSIEYVARVLRVWDVDALSLDELAGLYREARFSTHALSEPHRERAIVALGTIRGDLGRARPAPDEAGRDPATHGGRA
ncbi:DUF4129 domain-containing protein [Intrasporangium calvum]|uniref:DUF4129 domain-containing protein n=1 Tax=Intrasporangium calvum TaxID=53358 RepID=A0ABT5GLD5_9MICO|nr:DUF4129 domain-containing protein [Intrasporangium calvum]MDC5698685.1 DUF4129 domain-containing protein [Intrasporangium calvum]